MVLSNISRPFINCEHKLETIPLGETDWFEGLRRAFHPETALLRNLGVTLPSCLCDVSFDFGPELGFFDLAKIFPVSL